MRSRRMSHNGTLTNWIIRMYQGRLAITGYSQNDHEYVTCALTVLDMDAFVAHTEQGFWHLDAPASDWAALDT